MMAVSGVIAGQLGAGANTLTIKARPRNGVESAVPELEGELIFKDMLRINGHVAGTVSSLKGTLIVDTNIARLFPLQVFHLLGFRRRRWVGNKLVVSRRKHDTDAPFKWKIVHGR